VNLLVISQLQGLAVDVRVLEFSLYLRYLVAETSLM